MKLNRFLFIPAVLSAAWAGGLSAIEAACSPDRTILPIQQPRRPAIPESIDPAYIGRIPAIPQEAGKN